MLLTSEPVYDWYTEANTINQLYGMYISKTTRQFVFVPSSMQIFILLQRHG